MATDAAVHSTVLTPAELHTTQQMTSIVIHPLMTALTLLCSVPDQKKKNCLYNALFCCCTGSYGNITKIQENLFWVTRCYKFEFSQSYYISWFNLIHYNLSLRKLTATLSNKQMTNERHIINVFLFFLFCAQFPIWKYVIDYSDLLFLKADRYLLGNSERWRFRSPGYDKLSIANICRCFKGS